MAEEAATRTRITRSICETIKGRIAAGSLAAGARLPSTRSLAAEWGVSRTTVTAAYEQLIAEGYLETRQGARTQVAQGLGLPPTPGSQTGPAEPPDRLSAYGRRLAQFILPPVADRVHMLADFRYGDLSAEDFPLLAWRKAVGAALQRRHGRLRYDDPRGSSGLRTALQGYLWRARGLRYDPDQIIVTNGSQQGLDLCARLLLDPGDRAVMENPGYLLAHQVFQATGAELFPVAVDQDGMQTSDLYQSA